MERDRLKAAITQIDSSHLCDLLEEALTVLDDVAARWQSNLPSRIRKAVREARAALERQEEEEARMTREREEHLVARLVALARRVANAEQEAAQLGPSIGAMLGHADDCESSRECVLRFLIEEAEPLVREIDTMRPSVGGC